MDYKYQNMFAQVSIINREPAMKLYLVNVAYGIS